MLYSEIIEFTSRYVEGSTLYEGSVRNFYSPFESPEASDDEEEVGVQKYSNKEIRKYGISKIQDHRVI